MRAILSICGFAVCSPAAAGLFLTFDVDETPPEIVVAALDGELEGLRLSLLNDGDPIQVASVQFALGVRPHPGASGSLTVTTVDEPPGSLFGVAPMAIGTFGDRTTHALSAFPVGALLGQGNLGAIAEVGVAWSQDASGVFELVATPINAAMPLDSSHWIEQNAFGLQPYGNLIVDDDILLATIGVREVPEPSGHALLWAVASCPITWRRF